ncbi:TPA: hypothetical protein LA462_000471 [Clostridium botulinum]|nr:hypothetical protein [Clostridium botulinum]
MSKSLVIPLSFKTTSLKELELYKRLFELDDRGDELKKALGEIYYPEKYIRKVEKNV